MAAFHHPTAALRAQGRLADSGQSAPPLPLRVGIHTGPCIAVTLNDRLDYFGSTVNLAARLEGLSTGHDIIASDAVATAPDVRAWLATEADTLSIERFETTLKGFDTERFTVCRIRRCRSSDAAHASRLAGGLDAEAKRNRMPSAAHSHASTADGASAGHSAVSLYRAAAILVLNAILLLLCFEVAASGVYKLKNLLLGSPEETLLVGEGSPRQKISYYASQPWAPEFWNEFRLSRKQLRYVPYVGWRRPAFEGKLIRIDQDGIRFTPGADCRPGSYKVFAFGASTLWGTGAPDWGTIPAYIQAGLAKRRSGLVCVVNFGETGYVSTQDVITLMMQLQAGNVPDLAVFYDGSDDIYAAYQSGHAGGHQNADRLAAIFERRDRSHPLLEWAQRSASFSLVSSAIKRSGIAKPGAEGVAMSTARELNIPALSDGIVETYLGNYTLVSALAEKHHFKFFFFWQPFISVGQKRLTSEEQEIRNESDTDATYTELVRSVYHTIAETAQSHKNLHDLAHVFDGCDGLLWIDSAHVTPPGNELLAVRMLQILEARSSARDSRAASSQVSAITAD
jgi:hypothetical protein